MTTEADIKNQSLINACQSITMDKKFIDEQKDAFINDIQRKFQERGKLNIGAITNGTAFIHLSVLSNNTMSAITEQISVNEHKTILSVKSSSAYKNLEEHYKKEIKSKSIQNPFIDLTFENLGIELQEINYKSASVEITPRNSLKFTFGLENSRVLMISKSLDQNDDDENVVVYSIFENRELLISDASEVSELVKGVKEHLTV